jgi:DNA-binding transcriptional LysR family regulator
MSLLKLRILELLDRHKQVTAVAKALNMSQPTVSFHMKKMESEWGVTLFEAKTRRIYLTNAGKMLLPFAQQIGALHAEAEAALGELKDSGRALVRIGCTDCALATLLKSDWLAETDKLGGIRVKVIKEDEQSLDRLLEANRLDLVICGQPLPDTEHMQRMKLLSSPLKLLLPTDDPLSLPGADLSMALLRHPLIEHAERSIADLMMPWMTLRQQSASPGATLDSVEWIMHAVRSGRGMAVLPECALPLHREGVASTDLPGHPKDWTLYASWKSNYWNAPLMESLVLSLQASAAASAR